MRRAFWAILLLTAILAGLAVWILGLRLSVPLAPLPSMDTGTTATAMLTWDRDLLADWGRTQPWLRIRGHPMAKDRPEAIIREALALRELSAAGFKPVIFLRWGEKTWYHGIRPGGGQRMPLDLREAYQRGYDQGRLFGHTGAAFEIENEPDISFVQDNAETYVAFQKAMYLGVKAGSGERGDRSGEIGAGSADSRLPARRSLLPARVIMAPLALPPGPYFEQMIANGLFSYTDAFNYHYYGYAEDFAGVYEQFEAAVTEVGAGSGEQGTESRGPGAGRYSKLQAPRFESKTLPVLLSEYGYGALGKTPRHTVEGRVRQWRWFKAVGEDIVRLRIAGPMAFYLPPYLEADQLEFGLSVRAEQAKPKEGDLRPETGNLKAETENRKPETGNLRPETGNLKSELSGPSLSGLRSQVSGLPSPSPSPPSGLRFQVSGLSFSPSDFGETTAAPWMRRIGERYGENEAMPALAWLMDEGARRSYVPKDWNVTAPPPSPVVIDFIAGDGLTQAKRYGGYVAHRLSPKSVPAPAAMPAAKPAPPAPAPKAAAKVPEGPPPLPWPGLPKGYTPPQTWYGTGAVVLYNFSERPVSGHLEIERGRDVIVDPTILAREWTLAPMSRTVVEINVRIPAMSFERQELAVRFEREKRKPETGDLRPETGKRKAENGNLRPETGDLKAVFSTAFFPNYPLMRETMLHDFAAENEGNLKAETGNLKSELSEPSSSSLRSQVSGFPPPSSSLRSQVSGFPFRASEEPILEPQGRWRVSKGVTVEELPNRLSRFTITGHPDQPEKSGIAELPLPAGFTFPDQAQMRFFYRLAQPAGTGPETGRYMEAYFRTANGNLYQVWPRQFAMHAWSEYIEAKENFTMAFYGRANLPWRFKDNQPVALVFFFRPRDAVPAVYEVKDARVVELGR